VYLFPIGGFLLAAGVIGFLIWRNLESLFLGIAPGAAIFVLGITSLKVWRGGKSSVPFILAQAGYYLLQWLY
jgi:Transmembrane proteins 14C